jgi:hypothetical protein
MQKENVSLNGVPDLQKLLNSGLMGALLYMGVQVSTAYQDLTRTLEESRNAQIELLELHREWYGSACTDYQSGCVRTQR